MEAVSHYKIRRKIGSGGMGEVFEAEDVRLGRVVALKILPQDVAADAKRVHRFAQEARAASTLNHPSITKIYEFGEADGTQFIAMELLEGRTLDQEMRLKSFTPAEAVPLILQVAEALQEAHSKKIIHRDIKPSNIMLLDSGQVKILDFGLSKLHEPAGAVDAMTRAKTEPGILMGTVCYMSPEQALAKDLDGRSDLFSLGVVLYEMISGKRPFSGPNTPITIDQIVHADPESISALASTELERILFKCLRKDPGERYQSAADLAADLRALQKELSGGATVARMAEYRLPRNLARLLFVVLQFVYLTMYLAALRWSDGMEKGLEEILKPGQAEFLMIVFVVTAMAGIAMRLYFLSLVAWDHVQTGVQFRKIFPLFFLFDILWALAPFGLSLKIGHIFALACVPPLVFSPFSQRTLIASAYNLKRPVRSNSSGA